jgi:hypothetical protein
MTAKVCTRNYQGTSNPRHYLYTSIIIIDKKNKRDQHVSRPLILDIKYKKLLVGTLNSRHFLYICMIIAYKEK